MIKLFRHTDDMVKEVMKKYEGCSVVRTGAKEHTITCDDKKVEIKKVVKTDLVDMLDKDGNNHITQKEVVMHFAKENSVKETVKILDEIDSDNNGRITKKEVKTFVEKNDK